MEKDYTFLEATQATFLVQGFNAVATDAAHDNWGRGEIELHQYIIEDLAPIAQRVIAAGYAVTGGFPGVVEYEVTETMGNWLGDVMRDSYTPGDDIEFPFSRALAERAYVFFADGAEREIDRLELAQALCTAAGIELDDTSIELPQVLPVPKAEMIEIPAPDWKFEIGQRVFWRDGASIKFDVVMKREYAIRFTEPVDGGHKSVEITTQYVTDGCRYSTGDTWFATAEEALGA